MAFTGRFYWVNDNVVECWDSATGVVTPLLVYGDPRLSAKFQGHQLGNLTLLPDDGLMVRVRPSEDFLSAVRIDPTGQLSEWRQPVHPDGRWSDFEFSSGAFDPVTGITWTDWSIDFDGGTKWAFTGLDLNGQPVGGLGNVSLINPGNQYDFLGAVADPTNITLVDRTLYRWSGNGDHITRYNLDTGVWDGVWPNYSLPYDFILVGVVTDLNMLVTTHASQHDSAHFGFIQLWDIAAQPWTGIVASDGILPEMPGEPVVQYCPWGSGGPTDPNSVSSRSEMAGSVLVRGHYAYYLSAEKYTNFGDVNGVPYGNVRSMWEMDLTDGSISHVFDVPYRFYNASGGLVDYFDPDFYTDNMDWAYGLQALDLTAPALDGGLTDSRSRFWR